MAWVPGAQRFDVWLSSDRIPHGASRSTMIGFRSPGFDVFYPSRQDISTVQLLIRGQIPTTGRPAKETTQGLVNLGR